jgi:hypothetical protein
MEIIISSIADKGDLKNERIGFKVLKDCQLKYFIVFKTTKSNNGFTNSSKNAFWFLPTQVNAGNKIVLYTKKGTNSMKENKDGTLTYFFYWKLETPLFKSDKDKVVLINVDSYKLE